LLAGAELEKVASKELAEETFQGLSRRCAAIHHVL
jgi:hypothetical protein